MRLIINKFSKYSEGRVDLGNRYPQNLYRDDQVCFFINKFLIDSQREMLVARLASDKKQQAERTEQAIKSFMATGQKSQKSTVKPEERV